MTPPTFDPVAVLQNVEDATYSVARQNYIGAVNNWIKTNIANRDQGLPLSQFTSVKPTHKVYSLDSNRQITFSFVTESGLPDPILPAPTPVLPSVPLSTNANAVQDAQTALLIQILNKVTAIEQKLNA